ncbi:MAG: hypothetical protein JSU78_00465 [Deltaproteobacteria bacterium]|nr:MAG: hypothetical protein JSU78_00465 [Deltaproteobacteria bacterium]
MNNREILSVSNVSRLLSVVSCDYIFKHLDEVLDFCILLCYLDELLKFCRLDNGQLSTDTTHLSALLNKRLPGLARLVSYI